MKKLLVNACLAALLLALCACQRASGPASSSGASPNSAIQSKARVFDLTDSSGFTKVGIMSAYDPETRSFWWRPTPFIASPDLLESYFERCKFHVVGKRVVSFCVRGNEVVINHTSVYADSIDHGLDDAQAKLQRTPGLLMDYHEARDHSFDLQRKAGVDMNTPAGVPPTVVRSVRRAGDLWELDVTCGCGDAIIILNKDLDFIGFKRP